MDINSIILGCIAAIPGAVALYMQRKKDLTDDALDLYDRSKQEQKDLEARIEKSTETIARLENHTKILEDKVFEAMALLDHAISVAWKLWNQLQENKIVPVVTPPTRRELSRQFTSSDSTSDSSTGIPG